MYKKATTGRLEERWRYRAFLPSKTQRQNMTTMVAYEAGRQAGASPSQNLPQSIPELQRQLTYPYQQTRPPNNKWGRNKFYQKGKNNLPQ
jgi:hypothetical protein